MPLLTEVFSMTDTIPLSPAAQAVLKAACIHHGLFHEEIVQRRRMIAAALRAAAEQGETLYSDGCPVHAVTVSSLLAIARELDA